MNFPDLEFTPTNFNLQRPITWQFHEPNELLRKYALKTPVGTRMGYASEREAVYISVWQQSSN